MFPRFLRRPAVLAIELGLVLLGLILVFAPFGPDEESPPAAEVAIDADGRWSWRGAVALPEDATALRVLREAGEHGGFDVVVVEHALGPYVDAIAGYASNATGGWTYWVEREGERIDPQVGAGEFLLAPRDVLHWEWTTWG